MAQKKTDYTFTMVGSYFHSFADDGSVHWQGQVVGQPEPGFYLVMTFSWMDGTDYCARLVRVEEMTDWWFYPGAESMNNMWEHKLSRRNKSCDDG